MVKILSDIIVDRKEVSETKLFDIKKHSQSVTPRNQIQVVYNKALRGQYMWLSKSSTIKDQ